MMDDFGVKHLAAWCNAARAALFTIRPCSRAHEHGQDNEHGQDM
jgi:hypothetical protein